MEFLSSQICILICGAIRIEKSKHHLSLTLNTKNHEPDGDKLSICLNIVMFINKYYSIIVITYFLDSKLFEVS